MASEKTEQPTPKKLREARDRGEVPKSRELTAAVGVLAAAVGLQALGPGVQAKLVRFLGAVVGGVSRPEGWPPGRALEAALAVTAAALAPVLLVVFAATASTVFLQVGPVFAPGRAAPKLERLDPAKGLGNLVSRRPLVELTKTLLVILMVGYVAVHTLMEGMNAVASAPAMPGSTMSSVAGALGLALLYRVGFALLAIGVADLIYQRYRHRLDLRMSKDEVKREMREAEGDPHAKQARARMHREIVEHAAVEEVRRADVLVVNPTHYAVALHFDREGDEEAPEILAKGRDHLARRMIEAARESGVPILRDVPLAHALYELEVGDMIPESLYEAVAAVLQVAWAERREREGSA